jgi:hypothetical protein
MSSFLFSICHVFKSRSDAEADKPLQEAPLVHFTNGSCPVFGDASRQPIRVTFYHGAIDHRSKDSKMCFESDGCSGSGSHNLKSWRTKRNAIIDTLINVLTYITNLVLVAP